MNPYSLHKTPKDYLEIIAKKVIVLRKEKGITQTEMAKRSGVSYGSIKRFETNGQIALESLLKILHVLNRLDDFNLILNKDQEPRDSLFTIK